MQPKSQPIYLQIAIAGPMRQLFDYRSSLDIASTRPGCRVVIPFGKHTRVGIIIGHRNHSALASDKVKHIKQLLDEEPILNDSQLKLAHWASRYYHHSLGDICFSMLPKKLRTTAAFQLPYITFWRINKADNFTELNQRAHKQKQCMELLEQHQDGIAQSEIVDTGIDLSVLKRLEQAGRVESFQQLASDQTGDGIKEAAPQLTDEQSTAINAVATNQFKPYLLNGITGSGKTEVYIQVVKHCLENNQQALILVPEIGLTPQTINRFKRRLNYPIRVIHSGLNETEQMHMWSLASLPEPQVVIATRSGLFVSLPELGIIIVDEEHDQSYKQPSGWRYSARDLAILRAKLNGIPVILGSATPSLETKYQVAKGDYEELLLTERPQQRQETRFELLDIRKLPLDQGLSLPLIDRIQTALSRGEQVLVFLNRRGYAPVLMCHECGWLADCERCDSHYTFHHHKQLLRCHHCEAQRPTPTQCPDCGANNLTAVGQGTERVEHTLARHFPNVSMARIDRDTTRTKGAMSKYISDIKDDKYQLLIGTQMLAKGHHFPNLALVAIIDMDGALYCADFRATERFGQLLKQVSGRAGRANQPGTVVIQTRQPDHPLIHTLLEQSYNEFIQQILSQRQASNWPPFVHLALLHAEATNDSAPLTFLQLVKDRLSQSHPTITLLGPVPGLKAKRSGKYRFQLLLQSTDRSVLHLALDDLQETIDSEKLAKTVRWSLDVDPQDLV